jgi:hypothetical protein
MTESDNARVSAFDVVTSLLIFNSLGDSGSGWICGPDYAAVIGGVVAVVDQFCRNHGQTIEILMD